jgi:two-component system chemotaxis response regulator CheY
MAKRVLLVDDSRAVRRAMGNAFKSAGFEVCGEAEDGAKGVERAQQLRPDLIVLDLSMPVMDGLQAGRVLRDTMPEVPIILFTLYATNRLTEEASALGMSVVSKQADTDDLINKAYALLTPNKKS